MSSRITIVSLQTFGDYMLKAPLIHELFAAHGDPEITIVTNPRGVQVYPLIDSRLNVVGVNKAESRSALFLRLRRIPTADILYLVDQHPGSCLMALTLRARRRVGWYQSVSWLYHGKDLGFRDRYALKRILSEILRLTLTTSYLRSPESLYEGHVELGLLESPRRYPRLAQYRTAYSLPPRSKANPPVIFCATLASWVGRQLDEDRWIQVIQTLLEEFPGHGIVLDAADSLMSRFSREPRVTRLIRSEQLSEFFGLVSSADVVIASDSFVTHVASWFDVAAVILRAGHSAPLCPNRAWQHHPVPSAAVLALRAGERVGALPRWLLAVFVAATNNCAGDLCGGSQGDRPLRECGQLVSGSHHQSALPRFPFVSMRLQGGRARRPRISPSCPPIGPAATTPLRIPRCSGWRHRRIIYDRPRPEQSLRSSRRSMKAISYKVECELPGVRTGPA